MAITTNEILIPKKLFGARVDKELEFDSQIPEFCPDIARLIKVDCTPFAESCEVDDGKAVVKGRVVYDVLYETDYKSRLRCCSFTQEFNQIIPLPRSSAENVSAFCKINCDRISCKLLSPRRLVIKSTFGTMLNAEGSTPVKMIAVSEDKEAFFKSKVLAFDGETKQVFEDYRFSEAFPLSQSERSIGEIVCGSVYLQQPQISLSSGRAEIKSTATAHILCEEESEEGRYYVSVKTLPISIDFQNDLIDSEKHISVSLEPTGAEFKSELDQYGESRVIKADFSVKMKMHVNNREEITVANDVFEKGFDSNPLESSVSIPRIASVTDVGFSEEAKIDSLMPSATRILDTSVKAKITSSEPTAQGVNLKGVFVVTLIYDSENGIQSQDYSISFDRFFDCDSASDERSIYSEIYPIEAQSTLHSDGSVLLRVVASANLVLLEESEETFVSDIVKRTPCNENDDCSLIYCFPKQGEALWDIAKRYKVDPKSVLKSNQSVFDEDERANDCEGPILIKI